MQRFNSLPMPLQEGEGPQQMADALENMQSEISDSLQTVHDLDVRGRVPGKLSNGMIRYADGVAWDPGYGAGPYVYRQGAWVPMWPEEDYLTGMVSSGGTTLRLGAVSTSLGSLTPTPALVTGYDTVDTPEEDAQASIPNSTIQFLERGFWLAGLVISGTVAPDTSNATRDLACRLYNVTDAQAGEELGYCSIPRYGEVFSLQATLRAGVNNTLLNKEFGIQIFTISGHTIPVLTLETLEFWVARVSHKSTHPVDVP